MARVLLCLRARVRRSVVEDPEVRAARLKAERKARRQKRKGKKGKKGKKKGKKGKKKGKKKKTTASDDDEL